MCAIGGWLVTRNTADQIGHLVIKSIGQDSIRVLDESIADNAGLGDACQSRGLFQPCLSSSVKPNTLHANYRITWPSFTTGLSSIAPTARMPESGGLMMAVNWSTSYMPRFEMLKLLPR